MRIIDSNSTSNAGSIQNPQTTRVGPGGGRSVTRNDGSSTSDIVDLSSFSGRLLSAVQSSATERGERVARISLEVQSGAYRVDTQALSRAMVDSAMSPGDSE